MLAYGSVMQRYKLSSARENTLKVLSLIVAFTSGAIVDCPKLVHALPDQVVVTLGQAFCPIPSIAIVVLHPSTEILIEFLEFGDVVVDSVVYSVIGQEFYGIDNPIIVFTEVPHISVIIV